MTLEQRDLFRFGERYGVVFAHTWSVGDLLVWDNRSVAHKGMPCVAGRKVTRRVTVAG